MVKRLENWPLLLSRFLRERRDMPFEWGKNDCVLFAADAVCAITGIDFAEGRRDYATEAEAAAISEREGGIVAMVNKHLGQPSRNIMSGKRGDVVYTGFKSLGIIDDKGRAIAVVTKDGMSKIPLKAATRIWSY